MHQPSPSFLLSFLSFLPLFPQSLIGSVQFFHCCPYQCGIIDKLNRLRMGNMMISLSTIIKTSNEGGTLYLSSNVPETSRIDDKE